MSALLPLVFLSLLGLAGAGAATSRPAHIKGTEQWLPAPNLPKKQLFQGFQGTQPRAQHRFGVWVLGLGSAGLRGSAPPGHVAQGVWVQLLSCRTDVLLCSVLPQVLHPALEPLAAPSQWSLALKGDSQVMLLS